ncbi:MAG TPA: transcriptional regulator [bacterium]|nr:transcriptional regulator [bacterium]
MSRFADVLKKYRHGAGLTQQQLGDRLRLSSPYIAQIETGLKPPPSQEIVERIGRVLRLDEKQLKGFVDLARQERGRQSLLKATTKLGYAISGNQVLVSESAIRDAVDRVLSEMFREVNDEAERGAFVRGFALAGEVEPDEDAPPILRRRGEMLEWVKEYLGEEPHIGLTFLSLMYERLSLGDSSELIYRDPTLLRLTMEEERKDPGRLLARLKAVVDETRRLSESGTLSPQVASTGEATPSVPSAPSERSRNRYIPVIGVIPEDAENIVLSSEMDPVEIPRSWLKESANYRAVEVRSSAFQSFGIWPGARVLFEADAQPVPDDLVVLEIDHRLTIMVVKIRMAEGENMILQGGGPSAPVVYMNRNRPAIILGVVRHFLSTFGDLKRSKLVTPAVIGGRSHER